MPTVIPKQPKKEGARSRSNWIAMSCKLWSITAATSSPSASRSSFAKTNHSAYGLPARESRVRLASLATQWNTHEPTLRITKNGPQQFRADFPSRNEGQNDSSDCPKPPLLEPDSHRWHWHSAQPSISSCGRQCRLAVGCRRKAVHLQRNQVCLSHDAFFDSFHRPLDAAFHLLGILRFG